MLRICPCLLLLALVVACRGPSTREDEGSDRTTDVLVARGRSLAPRGDTQFIAGPLPVLSGNTATLPPGLEAADHLPANPEPTRFSAPAHRHDLPRGPPAG